jgi:hypothetical protein
MNKRNRFRIGLSFGIAMAVFFILQNLVTSDKHTTNQIIKSIASGLVAGAISGVLFGWLMGLFAKSKFVTQTTKIVIGPDENILFETPANHFKGIEGVGGKLYLTNKRLVFKSHKLNIQNHELSIQLTDIKNVDRHKTLGIVNNGLTITTINDKIEKFVVEQVENWIKYLTEKNGLQQAVLSQQGGTNISSS